MFGASDKTPRRIHRPVDSARTSPTRAGDVANGHGLAHLLGYRERFAPRLLLLGLFLGTLVAMYFLYPKTYIEKNLGANPRPDATTLSYLQLLVRVEPKNERLRLLLVREALAAGQLRLAQTAFAPWRNTPVPQLPLSIAMLRLRIRLITVQAAPANSPDRVMLADGYVHDVLALAPRMQPQALLQKAKVVLAMGRYGTAADIDRLVIRESTSARLRRTAFYDGINAFLAANQPATALAFAQSEIGRLTPDDILWRRLTRLALSANRPLIAAKYARQLVGMRRQ